MSIITEYIKKKALNNSTKNRKHLLGTTKNSDKVEKSKGGSKESISINISSKDKYVSKKSSSPRAGLFKKFWSSRRYQEFYYVLFSILFIIFSVLIKPFTYQLCLKFQGSSDKIYNLKLFFAMKQSAPMIFSNKSLKIKNSESLEILLQTFVNYKDYSVGRYQSYQIRFYSSVKTYDSVLPPNMTKYVLEMWFLLSSEVKHHRSDHHYRICQKYSNN